MSLSPSAASPFSRRQALEKRARTPATSADHAHARVARVRRRSARHAQGLPRINSNNAACIFPFARVPICDRPAIRVCASSNERNRAPDIAERPRCERQVTHRRDAGVPSEAKRQIVVAAGLEQDQRAFQMVSRIAILSGEPTCDPDCPMGDAGLGRIGPRLDVTEERLGVGPHRRQLARERSCRPISRSRPPALRAHPCRQPPTHGLC